MCIRLEIWNFLREVNWRHKVFCIYLEVYMYCELSYCSLVLCIVHTMRQGRRREKEGERERGGGREREGGREGERGREKEREREREREREKVYLIPYWHT